MINPINITPTKFPASFNESSVASDYSNNKYNSRLILITAAVLLLAGVVYVFNNVNEMDDEN